MRAYGDVLQNINFAIELGTLKRFLKTHSVRSKEAASVEELRPADIGDNAKRFTYLIECEDSPTPPDASGTLPRHSGAPNETGGLTTEHLRWCADLAAPPEMAVAACTRAIEVLKGKGGDLAALYDQRGRQQFRKHDVTSAISDFSAAIRLNPKFAKAYNGRGTANLKLGKIDEAVADYNAALRLNPYDPDALFGRGLAKWEKRDITGSIDDRTAARAIKNDIEVDFHRYGFLGFRRW